MKIKKLKKDNRKKIIIGVSITLLMGMGIVGFVGTKAKYKNTAEYLLASGSIHYKSGDLSVLAVNIENDSGEFTESDNIPGEGYILNNEKSYCGLSNGDGTYNKLNDITITYENGKVNVLNSSQRGTKCFLYFDKPNYLMVGKTNEEASNDVLGKEIARSSFEAITTLDSKIVPAGVIESWDASIRQNGSIMAWYTDNDNDGLYELFIGEDGGVIANPNCLDLFSRYTNVTNIDLSNFDTSSVTNMQGMFYKVSSLTNLDLSNFDTSNVTTMSGMFRDMTSLTSLDLSNFDTSNVTDISWMFNCMTNLTNLDINSFDTSKVTTMMGMFSATKLTTLDLSHFDTSQVKVMNDMFSSTKSLTNLNISTWDTSNVEHIRGMFWESPLQTLNLSNATFDKVVDSGNMLVFSSISKIIVKDANAKEFINARLSEAGMTATVTLGF